eukprot:COSAG06_NODE_56089_length_286_cov_1.101604_2_plen_55_part_01
MSNDPNVADSSVYVRALARRTLITKFKGRSTEVLECSLYKTIRVHLGVKTQFFMA